ncbi:protein cII, partial [Escherichia coli]
CYIVCVNQNLDAVRKKISTNVGIIVVDDISVRRIRKAKRIARQEKLCLASTIPVNELKKIVMQKKGLSKYELCVSLANEKSLAEIKSLSRKFLLNNIMKNFKIFHNEIGEILSPDDILTITRMPPGKILRFS